MLEYKQDTILRSCFLYKVLRKFRVIEMKKKKVFTDTERSVPENQIKREVYEIRSSFIFMFLVLKDSKLITFLVINNNL